ncbi:MAG: hypothetical protein G8237_02170 [Magnetococcales bacterium]|nr:hypothetical protein [Magnetococcales bacterium]
MFGDGLCAALLRDTWRATTALAVSREKPTRRDGRGLFGVQRVARLPAAAAMPWPR